MPKSRRLALEQQTVRVLSWHFVYGRSIPLLGVDGWDELAKAIDVPDFKHASPDSLCPMAAFNDALRYIDGKVGSGDGSFIRQIGRNSAQGWGSQNRALVQELQGQPKQMIEVLLTGVHNWFLDDPSSTTIVESAPDFIVCEMDSDLHEEFDIGLIEGFAILVGSEARVAKIGDRGYRITWRPEGVNTAQ